MTNFINGDSSPRDRLEHAVRGHCDNTLNEFYKRLQETISDIYPGEVEQADILFIMSSFLNAIRFFAKDIFFQLPNFFKDIPIPLQEYENLLLETLKDDFEEIRLHYEKKEKREDLIKFVTH